MMAAAMAILGTVAGVDGRAIASVVPTTAGFALLIDAGANTDVKPINLMQFGVMGSVYWNRVNGVERPRVAILSNGEEASKGTNLTRAAAAALVQMAPQLNYVGHNDGHDIDRAAPDVLVAGLVRRLAFLLVRRRLYAIRGRLDRAEYGGAPLLGVSGVTIIAHGSSNARAIRNAIRAAANEALVNQVNVDIVNMLTKVPPAMVAKP